MERVPEKMISVFRLTFWWEPHQDDSGNWRGYVSHDQLHREIAFNSPDDAFEIVRHTLARSSNEEAVGLSCRKPTEETIARGMRTHAAPPSFRHRLLSIWRRVTRQPS
jgi:hypothetical protein